MFLTWEWPFVTPFSSTIPLLLSSSVAWGLPILSSFRRLSNCFKFIDLFRPYSSNRRSTNESCSGPLTLRTPECEKMWESVNGKSIRTHRKVAFPQELFAHMNVGIVIQWQSFKMTRPLHVAHDCPMARPCENQYKWTSSSEPAMSTRS